MTVNEWRQHWRILPPCVAGVMLCAFHTYSLGVMIVPIEEEFGWLRSKIAGGALVVSLVSLFAAPLVGNAVDRFGARRIALLGIPLFCIALGLLSVTTANYVSWLLLWTLLALVSMLVIPVVWTTAINGYFVKNRGLALAITLCGTGLTASFVPALTNYLVQSFGWRGAYVGLGVVGFVMVFPLAWLFLYSAGRQPSSVEDQQKTSTPQAPLTGYTPREGFRSPTFIKLTLASTVFGVSVTALSSNAVPVLMDRGFSATAAAGFAGFIGMGAIVGRLLGGFLLDRLNPERIAAISVLLPLITVALLLSGSTSGQVASLAFFVFGLSLGTELDACAYLAARHFGLRSFGTLFGFMNGLLMFGAGVAPILANYIYDITQAYDLMLWALVPACLIACVLFLMLGSNPPDFENTETP